MAQVRKPTNDLTEAEAAKAFAHKAREIAQQENAGLIKETITRSEERKVELRALRPAKDAEIKKYKDDCAFVESRNESLVHETD